MLVEFETKNLKSIQLENFNAIDHKYECIDNGNANAVCITVPIRIIFARKYNLFLHEHPTLPDDMQFLKPAKFTVSYAVKPEIQNQIRQQTNMLQDYRMEFPPIEYTCANYLLQTPYEQWYDKLMFVKFDELHKLGVDVNVFSDKEKFVQQYNKDIDNKETDGGSPVFTTSNASVDAEQFIAQAKYMSRWVQDNVNDVIEEPFNNLCNETSNTKLGKSIGIPSFDEHIQIRQRFGKQWNVQEDGDPGQHSQYIIASSKGAWTGWHKDHGKTAVNFTIGDGCKYLMVMDQSEVSDRIWFEYNAHFIDFSNSTLESSSEMVKDSFNMFDTLEMFMHKFPQHASVTAQLRIKCYQVSNAMIYLPGGMLHAVFTSEPTIAVGGNMLSILNLSGMFEIYFTQRLRMFLNEGHRGDCFLMQSLLFIRDMVQNNAYQKLQVHERQQFALTIYYWTIICGMYQLQKPFWKVEPLCEYLKKSHLLQQHNLNTKYHFVHAGWEILYAHNELMDHVLSNYNSELLWKMLQTMNVSAKVYNYCKQKQIMLTNQKNMLKGQLWTKDIVQYLASVSLRNNVLDAQMEEQPLNNSLCSTFQDMLDGNEPQYHDESPSSDDDDCGDSVLGEDEEEVSDWDNEEMS